MPSLTVADIAHLCEGIAEGDASRLIHGANALESATPDELSFAANTKAHGSAAKSHAGCLLVAPSFDVPGDWSIIRVPEPRMAFARALTVLYARPRPRAYIHPSAVVAATASVANDCFIGPYAVIGEHTQIAVGCSIGDGAHIGDHVVLGERTTLHSGVTLYDHVRIGARVTLHSGCVIGADGFGFVLSDDHYEKFPQIGTVEIGNDVELGANCCVDRAALGVTRIGDGTKLDNLVHVAHNCEIGRHVVIAAQTGLAGGVIIGDYAVLGGQVGIGEKGRIAAKAIIASKAGILNSQQVNAGEPVWGIPARPVRQHLKGLANVGKVPELRNELRELKRRLAVLEAAQHV